MKIRNCAWLGESTSGHSRAVWARRHIVCTQCPKSVISSQSQRYLEIHRSWRSMGRGCLFELEAKTADAIELLEEAILAEEEDAKQK